MDSSFGSSFVLLKSETGSKLLGKTFFIVLKILLLLVVTFSAYKVLLSLELNPDFMFREKGWSTSLFCETIDTVCSVRSKSGSYISFEEMPQSVS